MDIVPLVEEGLGHNPLLAGAADEDSFVARLVGGVGSNPPYLLELRGVNRAGAVVLGATPPLLQQLTVEQVDDALAGGIAAWHGAGRDLARTPVPNPAEPGAVHVGLLERAGRRDVAVLAGGPGDLGELKIHV